MKKFLKSLIDVSRLKHLGLGILCGTLSDSWYATEYCGFGVGGALEFKDKCYGGKFDVIDIAFTVIGFNIGYGIKRLILHYA